MTPQVPHKLIPEDAACQKLILAIGNDSCFKRCYFNVKAGILHTFCTQIEHKRR